MTRGRAAAGAVLWIAGGWIIAQVTWGGALTRLGLLRSGQQQPAPQPAPQQGGK